MQIEKNKEYLTVKELADILHISRQAVFKKVKNGEIKADLVGKTYIIPKKSLSGIYAGELTQAQKKDIDQGVAKVIKEYGDVIKKLGEEQEEYGAS